jgi:hypothetical protein
MKTILTGFFLLCSAAAFGQIGSSISSQPQILEVPEHVQHADVHAMATERPLVGNGSDTYATASGERPLWEFGPVKQEVPLGDIARAYRKEKTTGKKAEVTLEKQGS